MNYVISIALGITVLWACGSKNGLSDKELSAQIEQTATEVMAIHDSVMPRTGEIFKLKKRILPYADSVATAEVKTELYQILDSLEMADKGMMDWMHTYKEPDPSLPLTERKAYFDTEKIKIQQVKKRIETHILSAQQAVEQYQIP